MKILVTGGTGTVGSRVVGELRRRGAPVRVLTRKQRDSGTPDDVEIATGDLLDPPSIDAALDGIDKLFLLNAVVPDELTQGIIAVDVAQRRRVNQIVYLSVFKAGEFRQLPHFASKVAIENALQTSGVAFTILRPGYFYQNDLALKDALTQAGIYPVPLGPEGVASIDARDIAEAAAIALTTEGHEGKTYNLVGPDMLSGPRAAEIWSSVLGRSVQYAGHDMDRFEQQFRQRAPAWLAFDVRMMFESYIQYGFAATHDDIQAVTTLLGRAPRGYEEFARETARMWQ